MRKRSHDYNVPLLIPFMLHSFVAQLVTVVTRVTTLYKAIELDLPVIWYGAISSGYALLPIFLAVPVGRYIDRGNDSRVVWAGSALTLVSNIGFWAWPDSAPLLLAYSVIGGIGHLFLMAGHQAMSLRVSGPVSREAVFGSYMMVLSIGQMLGPLYIGWMAGSARLPPTAALFAVCLIGAIVSQAVAFAMRPTPVEADDGKRADPVSVVEILRTKGLTIVILASVVTVTAFELIVIYLPLLGAERGIDASTIAMLLTVRALASIVARIGYPALVRAVGRTPLTFVCMMLGAAGFIVLGMTSSIAVMYGAVMAMGVGLGIAVTLCMSSVVELAPPNARGTALSLRLTGNRIGQFAIPFLSAVLATVTGVAGVFFLIAAALAVSGVSVKATMKR